MSELQAAADLARLLGDPTRLMLLQTLMRSVAPVSELLAVAGTTQSNLSNHIKLLRDSGLIEGTREGRQIVYRINRSNGGGAQLLRPLGRPAGCGAVGRSSGQARHRAAR